VDIELDVGIGRRRGVDRAKVVRGRGVVRTSEVDRARVIERGGESEANRGIENGPKVIDEKSRVDRDRVKEKRQRE